MALEGTIGSAPCTSINSKQTCEISMETPKKKGPIKCAHTASECKDKAVKIIGDCRYCQQKFCGKHRLPEAHSCQNLNNCRLESAAKNTAKLMGEKCETSKV